MTHRKLMPWPSKIALALSLMGQMLIWEIPEWQWPAYRVIGYSLLAFAVLFIDVLYAMCVNRYGASRREGTNR